MDKYLIHACPSRMWYVEKYLIPSMTDQGIDPDNILVYNDEKHLGNLHAYLDAAKLVMNNPEGTWHLQDDIVISSKFREVTEYYNFPVVCGFCNSYSIPKPGFGPAEMMWYSFPCTRILNSILKEFVEWMKRPEVHEEFKIYYDAGKFDDSFFRYFMIKERPETVCLNLVPNIVENVDDLLGGSLANQGRAQSINIKATYFDEPEVVEKLRKQIEENGHG